MHVRHVIDGDKCLRVFAVDKRHQLLILTFIDNGDNLIVLFKVIRADSLIDRRAAVQVVDDKLPEFFYEELKIGRKSGALIVTVSCAVIGAFCSLSLGATDALTFAGKSLFDWFDFVTGHTKRTKNR